MSAPGDTRAPGDWSGINWERFEHDYSYRSTLIIRKIDVTIPFELSNNGCTINSHYRRRRSNAATSIIELSDFTMTFINRLVENSLTFDLESTDRWRTFTALLLGLEPWRFVCSCFKPLAIVSSGWMFGTVKELIHKLSHNKSKNAKRGGKSDCRGGARGCKIVVGWVLP